MSLVAKEMSLDHRSKKTLATIPPIAANLIPPKKESRKKLDQRNASSLNPKKPSRSTQTAAQKQNKAMHL